MALQLSEYSVLHSRPKSLLFKIFSYPVYLPISGGEQDVYSILLETLQGPIMTPKFVQCVSPSQNLDVYHLPLSAPKMFLIRCYKYFYFPPDVDKYTGYDKIRTDYGRLCSYQVPARVQVERSSHLFGLGSRSIPPYLWQCTEVMGKVKQVVMQGVCRKNLSFKIFVVVIPKEGLVGGAPPIVLLVWHRLYNIICEGCR